MAEEEVQKPTISLAHTRVVSQGFCRAEVEALVTAELVRRAKMLGVEVNLNRGERTKVEIEWGQNHTVRITIEEDLAPVVEGVSDQ